MITRVPINFAKYMTPLNREESLKDFARVMRTRRGRNRFSSEPVLRDWTLKHPSTSRYLYGGSYPQLWPIATAQQVAAGDLVCKTAAGGTAGNDNIIRAQDVTYASAVATPTAPTLADGGTAAGTPLTNGATHVKISFQFPWGEGPLSAAGSVTPTLHAFIQASGLLPSAPALYTNIYVETAAGSGTYQLWGTTTTNTALIGSYGSGPAPSSTTYAGSALAVTQFNFAQLFIGQSNSFKDANVALVAGYSLSNFCVVNTNGVYFADLDTTYTWLTGDVFGPAVNAGATALQSQVLMSIAAGSGGPNTLPQNSGLSRLGTHLAVQNGTAQNYAYLQMNTVMAKIQR